MLWRIIRSLKKILERNLTTSKISEQWSLLYPTGKITKKEPLQSILFIHIMSTYFSYGKIVFLQNFRKSHILKYFRKFAKFLGKHFWITPSSSKSMSDIQSSPSLDQLWIIYSSSIFKMDENFLEALLGHCKTSTMDIFLRKLLNAKKH